MDRSNKLEELIKTSKNKEELRDSIKEAGVELSDEEIEAVVGGACDERVRSKNHGYGLFFQ